MVVALEKGHLQGHMGNVTSVVKKGHIQKDCRPKGNGSSGNQPKKSKNELPEWVNRKPTKDRTTATMNRDNKKYKWCISCNNGQGAWGFHWKDGHEEWKNKQGKKASGRFSKPAKNAVIYCSYLMSTSEESMEEESQGGDDSHNNDFISLSHFELLK